MAPFIWNLIAVGKSGGQSSSSSWITHFQSIQGATPSQITLYYIIDSGKAVTLDWGDGVAHTLTADGTQHSIVSSYSANSTNLAELKGDVAFIRTWYIDNSTVTLYTSFLKRM